jgi:hypothetical protein
MLLYLTDVLTNIESCVELILTYSMQQSPS